jgi:hypothetical protein
MDLRGRSKELEQLAEELNQYLRARYDPPPSSQERRTTQQRDQSMPAIDTPPPGLIDMATVAVHWIPRGESRDRTTPGLREPAMWLVGPR